MNLRSKSTALRALQARRQLLGWAGAVVAWPLQVGAAPAAAALGAVMPFEETTWQHLLDTGPRPAAYVFTNTYCPNCPEVFDQVRAHVASTRKKAELVVVLMDVHGTRALHHARYYVGATRLYAFEGFEPAIRQSIDPQWPNVTPYVVLLGAQGAGQRSIGAPEPRMLQQWL